MGIFRKIQNSLGGTYIPPTICWGTHSQAEALIPWQKNNTRRWAHAWVRRHFSLLPLDRLDVVDAGSGTSNRLLDWYRPRVKRAYLLDFLVDTHQEGNASFIQADIETGMPLPDGCADVVTSVSSVEHLSEAGQLLFFGEAARVLRPGGRVIMTMSYTFGLDEASLRILSKNPVLANAGFSLSARPDLCRMLERATALVPLIAPLWARLPGFGGFNEEQILADRDILFDAVFSGEPGGEEVNALGKRYAEIGIYLTKR